MSPYYNNSTSYAKRIMNPLWTPKDIVMYPNSMYIYIYKIVAITYNVSISLINYEM